MTKIDEGANDTRWQFKSRLKSAEKRLASAKKRRDVPGQRRAADDMYKTNRENQKRRFGEEALGEDGERVPGPRYHLDHEGKTVGDEKGYLSPGLAGRALKALPGHDKMHVVRKDATTGKVVKRWDHTMRFLEANSLDELHGKGSLEKIRGHHRSERRAYDRTLRSIEREGGGGTREWDHVADDADFHRVRVSRASTLVKARDSKHRGTKRKYLYQAKLQRDPLGSPTSEAHTLDQLEKRRVHHADREQSHRTLADRHERRAERAMTPYASFSGGKGRRRPRNSDDRGAETFHNSQADQHNHRGDRHAQAWDAATRLINRKKGIEEDDMRALTLKDILEGKSREKFKEKRRDGDKAEKRAKKRDVETVEEDTPVGRVSMTRSGSAHAHGILAVARALHGKKVKVAHKDNFGRSVKSAADARHGDVSIRDDVLEVPLDMVSEIFGPHALEDLQHALDELHGKGELGNIRRHHEKQADRHGNAGSRAELRGDEEGWERHYGHGVEHEQKYERASALMKHRDSDRITSRTTKRALRAHNPHPRAFTSKAYEDLEIDEGRGRPRKQANVQGGDQQEDPDSHIVVHLRKAITLRGQHSVAFQHGGPAKVAPSDAHLALLRHDDMHPRHREEFARRLGHSHDSFRRAITH